MTRPEYSRKLGWIVGVLLCTVSLLPGQQRDLGPPGQLFSRVAEVLQRSYYDQAFRRGPLRLLVERYRPAAEAAESLAEEQAIVHAMLAEIPTSHLALLETRTYRAMFSELFGKPQAMLGCQLQQRAGKFFITWLYEGGPADRAGLRRGDRVVSMDGVAPGFSPRLERRSDDAALADPPLHGLRCKDGELVSFVVEGKPGLVRTVSVRAAMYSSLLAAAASVRLIKRDGLCFGYVHFWMVHINGIPRLLGRLLREDFAACDGLILDLRGRGGAAHIAGYMSQLFRGRQAKWTKPFVALIDRGSRSAKEVIAHELKKNDRGLLVGEPTAGAVIPASFAAVGSGCTLMYPAHTLGNYTKLLEGGPVQPDVLVRDRLVYAAGADRILAGGVKALADLVRRRISGEK